jgi:3-oxoadipate enol-lactonase
VLAGELDQGTPVDMARTLADGIPDARLQVLAEASHLGAIEQPGTFVAAVTAFVDSL